MKYRIKILKQCINEIGLLGTIKLIIKIEWDWFLHKEERIQEFMDKLSKLSKYQFLKTRK